MPETNFMALLRALMPELLQKNGFWCQVNNLFTCLAEVSHLYTILYQPVPFGLSDKIELINKTVESAHGIILASSQASTI